MAAKLRVKLTQGLDSTNSEGAVEDVSVFVSTGVWSKIKCSAREYTLLEVLLEVGEALLKSVQVIFVIGVDMRGPGGE